jgi:hypothetical protein
MVRVGKDKLLILTSALSPGNIFLPLMMITSSIGIYLGVLCKIKKIIFDLIE